jgi:hypothetical protein
MFIFIAPPHAAMAPLTVLGIGARARWRLYTTPRHLAQGRSHRDPLHATHSLPLVVRLQATDNLLIWKTGSIPPLTDMERERDGMQSVGL